MTAIEILKGCSTLARAARHLQQQNDPALPRPARQALADATQTLLTTQSAMLQQRPDK